MDVSTQIGEYVFNFRVSAIIRNGTKVLLHKGIEEKRGTLPGGRVMAGERTDEALIRELKEEIGADIKIIKERSFIENFFNFEKKQKDYHELLMTYEAEFIDKDFYKKDKIEAKEEHKKGKLEFIWKEIEDLNEENFKPKALIKILKDENNFEHIINDERG